MFRPDAVYVVMLVEEDNSRDISGAAVLGAWKSQTALTWKAVMLSQKTAALSGAGKWPPSEQQKTAAAQAIADTMQGLASFYMEVPKGNDDPIGAPQRVAIQPGQTPILDFKGDGGHYKIRFKVV